MTLHPSQPPGRRSRKARAFAADIARLHALGYSIEGIRQALAESGVEVSRSTVWRELARASANPAIPLALPVPLQISPSSTSRADLPQAASLAIVAAPRAQPALHVSGDVSAPIPARSGKEIAEAFSQSHISNPLIRNRN